MLIVKSDYCQMTSDDLVHPGGPQQPASRTDYHDYWWLSTRSQVISWHEIERYCFVWMGSIFFFTFTAELWILKKREREKKHHEMLIQLWIQIIENKFSGRTFNVSSSYYSFHNIPRVLVSYLIFIYYTWNPTAIQC